MKVFTVTSGGDDPAVGTTLREAVARAERSGGPAKVVFADGVQIVALKNDIRISRGSITIDGDRDGDGISDVYIGAALAANTHHFTIARWATVILKDLGLYNGDGVGARGENWANVTEFLGSALDGRDAVQRKVDAATGTEADLRAEAARLPGTRVDGGNGLDGQDAANGGAGENGESVAGSIVNRGTLTLERVGFYGNDAVGGDGGNGAVGGRGQNGGGGGNGAVGAVEYRPTVFTNGYVGEYGAKDSGHGGNGGDGGDGGDGGAGGRGGDAASAVLNDSGARLTLIDVAFGGRMAWGLLSDRFGNDAIGGDGGQGGNGGRGGDDGSAGFGAVDEDRTPDGSEVVDTFDLYYFDSPTIARAYWDGQIRGPGGLLREYREDARGDIVRQISTAAGDGGDGGDGGNGGDAGGNGAGGNAAVIVN